MDHELKQRLIGAVVVTALAAIFIPMLFDDPVNNSGEAVTELTIPKTPSDSTSTVGEKLPADKTQVLNRPETELSVSEEDDSNAIAIAEERALTADDGQTKQPGAAQPLAEANSDIQGNGSVGSSASKEAGQNEEPSLDTGVVDEVSQPELSQDNKVKKLQQEPVTPTKKQLATPIVSEKPIVKPVITTEKPKAVAKNKKTVVQKSGSKLVRYSIQAGSFNKKENAQTLVEKLRKQGMPASIVAKGDLFRVKIGPELDKNKVKEMKAKLDKQNIKGLLTSE